jgi:glycosyltransferase involved in cell wall biosynthesis
MITLIIPTLGRPTLERALASVGEREAGDRVIVVADITDGPLSHVRDLCGKYQMEYHEQRGHQHGGVIQFNYGIVMADWDSHLVSLCDDDVMVPGALERLRESIARDTEPRIHMVKFMNGDGGATLGGEPPRFRGGISGCNFIPPKIPERIELMRPVEGTDEEQVFADFEWIQRMIRLWSEEEIVYDDFHVVDWRGVNGSRVYD